MKKALSLFLSICMLLSVTAGLSFSASALSSGSCGNNVTYSFNSSTGLLTISGSGAMYDYDNTNYYSNNPFYNQTSIKSVVIYAGVTSIGNYAFYSCSGLTNVEIRGGLSKIGDYAFCSCSGLISIESGNGVTSIGDHAFYNCSGLTSDSILEGATSIGDYAFCGCCGLTSVSITYGVTSIGDHTFDYCRGLTSVSIPNSVTSIGYMSFISCISLKSIEIPNNVTSIGGSAFYSCAITSLSIPSSVTSIGEWAFANCWDLSSITVDSGNTVYDCRNNCNAIIKTSNNELITGCKNTIIPNSVTRLGDYAFYGSNKLTSIDIPDCVTSIGERTFGNCVDLRKITIPDSVTSIGNDAFVYCRGLISITLGNSVLNIGDSAFYGCNILSSIKIPNSVTSIGNYAFYDCSALKELTLPCSAKIYNSGNTFGGCVNIEKVTLTKGTGTMQNYGTSTSSTATNTYLQYTPWYISRDKCKTIILEPGITNIGNCAFVNCGKLTSIKIPNSVKSVGDHAFYACSGLTNITIPKSLTSINDDAFNGCGGLTDCYYSGTENDWSNISIGKNNNCLTNSTIHYNYTCDIHTPSTAVKENEIAPTCTKNGSYEEVVYCSVCNTELSREPVITDALGHNYNIEITEPTCTKQGYSTYTCNRCDSSYVSDYTNPLGHTIVEDRAIAATCTTTGLSLGSHCSVCGEVLEAQETVSALGHSYNSVVTEPTCTERGYTTYTCNRCGESYSSDYTNALGHTEVIDEAVAPTCTKTGLTDGSHCSVCGEILVAQQRINALGHSYEAIVTAPTCTEQGYTTYTCVRCNNSYVSNYTNPLGHTVVVDEAVSATCTTTGLTAGKHCSVCNEILVAQKTINALGHNYKVVVTAPTCTEQGYSVFTCTRCGDSYISDYTNALGHTEVIDEAVAPTCTKTGLTEGKHCCVCGEVFAEQEIVSALGHSFEAVITEPTCTKNGYTTYTCSRCGNSYITDYTDALGHTEVIDEAVAPNCTETGLTEGKHCSVCGEILVAQEVVSSLGHDFGEWIEITPGITPTCIQRGKLPLETRYCSRCDVSETRGGNDTLFGSHNFDELTIEVIKEPTCTERGRVRKVYYCTVCKEAYIIEGDYYTNELGHDFGEWTETSPEIAATCTEKGKTAIETRYCSRCDAYETRGGEETAIISHTPGEAVYEVIFNPTCTNSGMYEKIICCTVCNAEISRTQHSSPALGHDYNSVVTAPTCTAQGYTTHTCTRCGDSYDDIYTDVLPHTPGEAVIENEVPATYEAEGSYDEVVYCSACNAELSRETKSIEKLHYHKYGYTTIGNVIQNTCTCDGSYDKEYHCGICDIVYETETVVVEKTGHVPMKRNEYKVAVSCTENGTYDVVTYCAVCNEEISRETKGIPATGHIYICQGKNEEGLLEYKCALCEEIHTESPKELFENWSADLINNDVQSTKYDDSSLFDVVADGVINAKDYAYLLRNSR